jgi:hypothetical protein
MESYYNRDTIANNILKVKEQIERKKGINPYISTTEQSRQVLTDYDVFPYTRYFRGIPTVTNPIVAEREAGFMTKTNQIVMFEKSDPYPNHCFQSSCSTIRPCKPKPDMNELHDVFHSSNILQYR